MPATMICSCAVWASAARRWIGSNASTCTASDSTAPMPTPIAIMAGIGSGTACTARCAPKAENMKIEPWAKFSTPIVPHARLIPSANSRMAGPSVRAFGTPWAISGGAGLEDGLARAVPAHEHAGHARVVAVERDVALRPGEPLRRDRGQALLHGGPVDAVRP